jgi:hypothetical protein
MTPIPFPLPSDRTLPPTTAYAAALRVLRAKPIRTSPTWRPGDTTRCVCPACDPDDEPGGDGLDGGYPARRRKVYRAPVASKRRHLTRAQRKAAQAQANARRASVLAWLDTKLSPEMRETTDTLCRSKS